MANGKIGKIGKVGNLRKIIPSFQFCLTATIENSDLKILEKNSEISEVWDFSTWLSNGLFQKKQTGRGNFQGYQRNSMWNFQGLTKNKVEFPRVTQKK